VVELALGGTSDDDNMVLAHQRCNENKSKDLSRKLNAEINKRLPSTAQELPDSWWKDVVTKQVYGALKRQEIGRSPMGKVPPRLVNDKDFYCEVPIM
jgi:hypothetical protein